MKPRLAPVSPEHGASRAQAGFARVTDYAAATNPVLGTLMWHPELTEHYMPFSDYMKNHGRFSVHHRRLVILRTAWNSGADYQWVAHTGYARAAGVAPTARAASMITRMVEAKPMTTAVVAAEMRPNQPLASVLMEWGSPAGTWTRA